MKRFLIVTLICFLSNFAYAAKEVDLDGFTVIREFNGTDNAALFGILPSKGKLKISHVFAPVFLGSYRYGELNESSINYIFQHSSKPMDQQERSKLLSKYKGAELIYFEGYNGHLCTKREIEYQLIVQGSVEGEQTSFETTYEIIALPDPNGDCSFHKLYVLTKSQPQLRELHAASYLG